MNTSFVSPASDTRHAGPHPGIVAVIFAVLFIGGLLPVTAFGGSPHFPGPAESAETIAAFFRTRPTAVLTCAALQFAAAIPLGVFTVTMVSRLWFHGVRAAGPSIALFGGLMMAFNLATSACILWVMAYPGIAQDAGLLRALYYLMFALGGVGYSVPLGLLIAGISVTAWFTKLLPKWIIVFGLVLAVVGELSWLDLFVPKALPLIPLTRFPGFIWLISAGFALPKALQNNPPTPR